MSELAGRVAFVVGADSPLGSRAARALAAAGARVALNAWAPDAVEKLAAQIAAGGGEALAFPGDASKKLALQSALEAMLADWGRVDMLVNAGAVQPETPILELDEWDWRRTLDLNVSAAFLATQSVGRVMRELGGGLIVNLLDGESNSAAYAIARGALGALAEAAAAQYAAYNVNVVSLEVGGDEGELGAALLGLWQSMAVGPFLKGGEHG